MPQKTRIAPTPSGFLHRGNLFAFALNWLMARKEGLSILLRIDDLDRQRYRPEYLEDIFRSLDALGLDYDEGPHSIDDFEKNWSQKNREDLYLDALQNLEEREALFACNCSRKDILARTADGFYDGHCLERNFKWQESENLSLRWKESSGEIVLKGWQQAQRSDELSTALAYPILYSKDGHVAYQLSSLVDDLHFGISHILRGEDLFDSSICQALIAESLDLKAFQAIKFHHHPLLMDGSKKLSKSQAAPAAEIYRSSTARKMLLQDLKSYLGIPSGESLNELLQEFKEPS